MTSASPDTFAVAAKRAIVIDPRAAALLEQLQQAVFDLLRSTLERAPGGELPALSMREQQVLQRLAAGDSNKMIARTLALSPHTVKRHVANILDKLGVCTRGQAAAWWLGAR